MSGYILCFNLKKNSVLEFSDDPVFLQEFFT